jgi:hypothetical protein
MTDNKISIKIMKKVFRYVSLAVCAFAAIALVSCDKDESTQNIPMENVAYFPIGNDVEIHPLGDDLYVSFTSEVDWRIDKSQCDWVDFSKTSGGKGTTELKISVGKYLGEGNQSNRSNAVMFKSESGETIQRVNFHQDALYLKVNDSDELVSDCSFDWKAGSQSITVTSNVLWEANFVDGNVEDAFSKGLNEGEKFGKPGELVTLRFDLNANDHNFSADSNKVKLMIVPVKVKGDVETQYEDDARTINVSQDNLIFIVSQSADPGMIEKDKFTENLDLDGFSELGRDYVSGEGQGFVNESDHITSQTFYVMEEVDENGNSLVEWNFGEYQADSISKSEYGNEVRIYDFNGRNVKVTSYDVSLTKANPTLDTFVCPLPLYIVDIEVDQQDNRARRLVNLHQKPYIWKISSGSLLAQGGDTASIKITTTGPWKIELPNSSYQWWETSNTVWEGVGNYEIHFNTPVWNLDLNNDETDYFNFSSRCNDISESVGLVKEHFHFNIGNNMVTDIKTSRDMLMGLLKKDINYYDVEVDCSGEWVVDYLNVPAWVKISGLNDDMSKDGNHNFSIGASEKNPSSQDREAMIVFTSKTHSGFGIDLRDTLLLKQMKHTFGWEPDEWSEEVKNRNCNHPAYIVLDQSQKNHTFGFSTTFSDDWTLSSDASWVQFHLGENAYNKQQSLSGTGESTDEQYVYVSVDNNFSTTQGGRSATVTVTDEFTDQSKSFKITQDAFVFDVVAVESLNDIGPLDSSEKSVNVTITEGAPWNLTITSDNSGLISSYAIDGQNRTNSIGTGSKQTVSLCPTAVQDVNSGVRQAKVTIKVEGSTLNKPISLKQKEFSFTLDKTSLSKFHEVTKSAQTVNVTCSGEWSFNHPVNNAFSVTRNGNQLSIVQKGVNTSLTSELQDKIIITTNDLIGGQQKTLTLEPVQSKYVFSTNIDSGSNSFEPTDDNTKSSTVKVQSSTTGWTFTSSGSGFTVNKSGTDKIIVKPNGKNYQTTQKSVAITVKSEHGHNETVNFSQKQYIFNTGTFADKADVKKEGETLTFTGLQCTGSLDFEIKAVNNVSWLDKSNVSISNGQMKVVIPANTGSERKVQIRLFSKDEGMNKDLTKTITLTQKAK